MVWYAVWYGMYGMVPYHSCFDVETHSTLLSTILILVQYHTIIFGIMHDERLIIEGDHRNTVDFSPTTFLLG